MENNWPAASGKDTDGAVRVKPSSKVVICIFTDTIKPDANINKHL